MVMKEDIIEAIAVVMFDEILSLRIALLTGEGGPGAAHLILGIPEAGEVPLLIICG